MTLTDSFLNEIAKGLNGETYNIPGYLAIGTTTVSAVDTSDTILAGEIAARVVFTGSRSDNVVSLSAIQTGAIITQNTGMAIKTSGIQADSTPNATDPLLAGVVHSGITQTTNFDIDFTYQITTTRG